MITLVEGQKEYQFRESDFSFTYEQRLAYEWFMSAMLPRKHKKKIRSRLKKRVDEIIIKMK